MSRHRLVAAALTAALVILGVAGCGAGDIDRGASGGAPCEGFATVYLVDGGALAARQTPVVGCGYPGAYRRTRVAGMSALQGLFAAHAGEVANAWAGDALTDLRRRQGTWIVDVAKPPTAPGESGRLVLQQLAWTLSGETQSSEPIEVEVGGMPLTSIDGAPVGAVGVPDPTAISPTGMSAWVRRTCEQPRVYVEAGRRRQGLMAAGRAIDPPRHLTTVTLRVGQRLRWLPDGLCFYQGAPDTTVAGVLRADGDRLRAIAPGTTLAYLGGGTCPASSFEVDMSVCAGGPAYAGWVRVRVTG